MKLEDMKHIAAARNIERKWEVCGGDGTFVPKSWRLIKLEDDDYSIEAAATPHNAEFIAMAANNWDKLMAVVEAAKPFLYHADYHGEYGRSLNGHHEAWKNIHEALKALEKE